jgi:hypothetical protein
MTTIALVVSLLLVQATTRSLRGPEIEFMSEHAPNAVEFEVYNSQQRSTYMLKSVRVYRRGKNITTYRVRLTREQAKPGDALWMRACYRGTSTCSEWSGGVRVPGERRRAA